MNSVKSHEDLEIRKLSIRLVIKTYKVTGSFPDNEKYVLASQMRKAAISIPSNIGEGAGRKSKREFYHSLNIAPGSLTELETQFVISTEIELLDDFSGIKDLINQIRIMICSLMRKLNSR